MSEFATHTAWRAAITVDSVTNGAGAAVISAPASARRRKPAHLYTVALRSDSNRLRASS